VRTSLLHQHYRRCHRRWADRQREREGRAFAQPALQPDPPAVQLDQPFADRQPQPAALLRARRILHLAELLEHQRLVRRRDPNPAIGYADAGHAVSRRRRAHRNPTPLGELDRICQQVEQHLAHAGLVDRHQRQIVGQFHGETQPLVLGQAADRGQHPL
jgi:hypothetical protein